MLGTFAGSLRALCPGDQRRLRTTYSNRITAAFRSPTVVDTVFPLTVARLPSCHNSTARENAAGSEISTVRAVRVGFTTHKYVPPAP